MVLREVFPRTKESPKDPELKMGQAGGEQEAFHKCKLKVSSAQSKLPRAPISATGFLHF